MLNELKFFDPTFVRLLAASIVAGFILQADWAIGHDFEYFSVRVFASALIIFLLLQAIRVGCRRYVPGAGGNFDDQYSESVLLLAVIPAFLVVENLFLRIVGILVYGAIVVRYISIVLRVGWARLAVDWLISKTGRLCRMATRAPVSYLIQDDVEKGVLRVSVSTREGVEPSIADIKKCVSVLYQELPDTERLDEIRVNVDGIDHIDGNLPMLLEPLSHYASLGNIEKVAIVTSKSRLKEISSLVPLDRFSVEYSGDA